LHGTAPVVDTWVLIEYPGPWAPRGFIDTSLPPAVKERIAALPPRHRVLLIRREYVRPNRIRCFVVHSRERSSTSWEFEMEDYGEMLAIDVANPPEQDRTETPFFLVCTHGRHDKCCSKFGLPAFRAIRERVGHDVWQCSHVGGDRFAANVLWFPYGLYYGHVCPQDIDPLLDASLRHQVHMKNFRGRSCYRRPAQVGEYFVRGHSGVVGLDQLNLTDMEKLSPTHWRTRFSESGSIYTAEFRCLKNHFSEYLSCAATEPKPVTQYELLDYSAHPAN